MGAAITEATTVSLAELADAIGETPQRLRPFVDAGILTANERGKFKLMLGIANYIRFWRSIADAADARNRPRSTA